jgi:ATP-dependent RNA helicase SUPV3L1/SUV3
VVEGARHTACTVEMVDMSRRVDVAVLDEIQMIGDESRGWAWTRALVGAPANELHV